MASVVDATHACSRHEMLRVVADAVLRAQPRSFGCHPNAATRHRRAATRRARPSNGCRALPREWTGMKHAATSLLTLAAPANATRFTSAVRQLGASSVAPAPTIVIDLDETVLYRTSVVDSLLLYAPLHVPSKLLQYYETGDPLHSKDARTVTKTSWLWRALLPRLGTAYKDALPCLHRLARDFRIVAVTARWQFGADKTHAWLAAHDLLVPTIHSNRPHPADDTRVAFKVAAIELLRERGWNPVVGIGDRASDLKAYRRAGLHAVMTLHAGAHSAAHGERIAALAAQLGRVDTIHDHSSMDSVWSRAASVVAAAHGGSNSAHDARDWGDEASGLSFVRGVDKHAEWQRE